MYVLPFANLKNEIKKWNTKPHSDDYNTIWSTIEMHKWLSYLHSACPASLLLCAASALEFLNNSCFFMEERQAAKSERNGGKVEEIVTKAVTFVIWYRQQRTNKYESADGSEWQLFVYIQTPKHHLFKCSTEDRMKLTILLYCISNLCQNDHNKLFYFKLNLLLFISVVSYLHE